MNHTPSKKIVALLVLVILVFLSMQFFVFVDIKKRNETIFNLEKEINLEKDKGQYLIALRRTIKSIDVDIASINGSILAKDEDVSFIENIESLARGYGLEVSIDSLVFVPDKTLPDNMTLFKVSAKTKGNWSATYAFVGALESLPVKVKLNAFGLTRVSENPDSKKGFAPYWQGSFDIVVLRYSK